MSVIQGQNKLYGIRKGYIPKSIKSALPAVLSSPYFQPVANADLQGIILICMAYRKIETNRVVVFLNNIPEHFLQRRSKRAVCIFYIGEDAKNEPIQFSSFPARFN